jgi:hypothetical protein
MKLLWKGAANLDEAAEMGGNARSLAERNFDRGQLAERSVDWLEQNANPQITQIIKRECG